MFPWIKQERPDGRGGGGLHDRDSVEGGSGATETAGGTGVLPDTLTQALGQGQGEQTALGAHGHCEQPVRGAADAVELAGEALGLAGEGGGAPGSVAAAVGGSEDGWTAAGGVGHAHGQSHSAGGADEHSE